VKKFAQKRIGQLLVGRVQEKQRYWAYSLMKSVKKKESYSLKKLQKFGLPIPMLSRWNHVLLHRMARAEWGLENFLKTH
jgi:hypothetical protein